MSVWPVATVDTVVVVPAVRVEGLIERVTAGEEVAEKVAETIMSEFMMREQVDVAPWLAHALPHVLKKSPASGVAVRTTDVPVLNTAEHPEAEEHEMPEGALVTVPGPCGRTWRT